MLISIKGKTNYTITIKKRSKVLFEYEMTESSDCIKQCMDDGLAIVFAYPSYRVAMLLNIY